MHVYDQSPGNLIKYNWINNASLIKFMHWLSFKNGMGQNRRDGTCKLHMEDCKDPCQF
jgi:hypothetical protein